MSEEDTTIEWRMEETWTHSTPITPDDITKNTVIVCDRCGGKSYVKDNKCIKCDHGLV